MFFTSGYSRYVESLNVYTNVLGYQISSTQMQQAQREGRGKIWLTNGRIFIGEFKANRMSEGHLYEMQQDNTYTRYAVKYNISEDIKNKVLPDN
jgi:hypothetical protein